MWIYSHTSMGLEDTVRISEEAVASFDGRIVLVPDTSFSTALDNRHWWAFQNFLTVVKAAQDTGASWVWLAPEGVLGQHNRFFEEGTVDEYFKLPLAHHRFGHVLGSYDSALLPVPSDAAVKAMRDWRVHSATSRLQRTQLKSDPGRADLEVIIFAHDLARKGANVYVATKDVMDIVSTLRGISKGAAWARNRIKLLPPSPIDAQYLSCLEGGSSGLELKVMVSGVVIKGLQAQWNPNISYPVVIFEKGVTSGNAVFAAGVGVVQKERFKPLTLPAGLESIKGSYEAVPAVRLPSINDEKAGKVLNAALKDFGVSRLVVVQQASPYFLLLASSSFLPGKINYVPLFRTDPDFLYWQCASQFAKATYKPVAQRAKAVSILK